MADGTHHAGRVGDRPLVADRRQPGRHPARLQRGHPRVPVGREGDRADDDLLDARRLRRDRAPARDRASGCSPTAAPSRGNLLSGEADEVILTVSRMEAEKTANPGYRAFLANGFNVTRVLVLFVWEVFLELTRGARRRRRDVRPRGHRGGIYPFLRAAMCVVVRDLIVYGVLTDMMSGRPAVYATFSSYDEVAHHSGLERADTLEALRKLDQQFGRIERARRFAPAPVRDRRPLRPRPDAGGDLQAAQRLRARRAGRSARSTRGDVAGVAGGDEQTAMVGLAFGRRPDARRATRTMPAKDRLPGRGDRSGLGQPRAGLPDGGEPAADARGDRGSATRG